MLLTKWARAALAMAAAAASGGAAAQSLPVSGAEAQDMLFAHDRAEIVRFAVPGIPDDEIAILMQVAQTQNYYGAVALAPGEGLLAEPTVAAANFHDIDAARAAALEQCNARRSGGLGCVVIVEIRPLGWEARPLQLNAEATAAFLAEFMDAPLPRALATSSRSGQWGAGQGGDATAQALAQCRAEGDPGDCRVVVED